MPVTTCAPRITKGRPDRMIGQEMGLEDWPPAPPRSANSPKSMATNIVCPDLYGCRISPIASSGVDDEPARSGGTTLLGSAGRPKPTRRQDGRPDTKTDVRTVAQRSFVGIASPRCIVALACTLSLVARRNSRPTFPNQATGGQDQPIKPSRWRNSAPHPRSQCLGAGPRLFDSRLSRAHLPNS